MAIFGDLIDDVLGAHVDEALFPLEVMSLLKEFFLLSLQRAEFILEGLVLREPEDVGVDEQTPLKELLLGVIYDLFVLFQDLLVLLLQHLLTQLLQLMDDLVHVFHVFLTVAEGLEGLLL
mmetsp:Transcript_39158/g.37498  ORF Transcript_39158/g.37498 Transcript_39158/m.37498 type:complete len:120 (+) Transcript_39158:2166-2525(+)